jgi:hypothetical protein
MMITNQNTQQNFQGYYQQPQQPQPIDLNPQTLSNILFVADLHEDMTEEDLSLFFKDFKFRHAKLYK